jgi:molybdopterin molybdotransferase
MLSVEEALHRIRATARLTEPETLPIARCAGRVLVERSMTATVDVPPFANSAMDGYAVRAQETPGQLRVVGEAVAGAAAVPAIRAGEAMRIMTGAPVPSGADAVVPVEEATEEAGGMVRLSRALAGQHVRAAGHDTRRGELIELPVAPLTPGALALLASLGFSELAVRRRPRAAILSTGDELVAPGAPLRPGQIHDANSDALAAAVSEAGGEPVVLPRAPDERAVIEPLLSQTAAVAEMLVTSGGVSMGRTDHVRDAIEYLGTLDFWRIRVQPGKPLAFGQIEGRPAVGLPGNPVSALVTFELFVRPLIRAMLGLPGDGRLHLAARLEEPIAKDAARRAYVRVVLLRGGDGFHARSAGGQGSAQLRGIGQANALLVIPEGEPAGEAGATYDAIVLGEIG